MDVKKHVSHQHVCKLLHNKFVVVVGDSIQRAVYKDIVLLLQKDGYLSAKQLKTKGEMSFEGDTIIEGGCLNQLHNGTGYKEVRQFRSDHHLVRFYFVTRIYSNYMRSILEDFRRGLKPDVLIVNSCVWDISRYNCRWIDNYKNNLQTFFSELKELLPEETLVIWNLTMPLGQRIKGGFLVPEIEHKAPLLRDDVIEANFYSGTLANSYELDVLDLHYHFRFSLQHRTRDGVHWNALAHRWISCLLLRHMAQAWGVGLPQPEAAVTVEEKSTLPDNRHVEGSAKKRKRQEYRFQENRYMRPPPPQPWFNRRYESDFGSWPYSYFGHDTERHYPGHYPGHRPYVLRQRHVRPQYAPYALYTQRHYNSYYHHY